MLFSIILHSLGIALLLYAGVCVVYFIIQEKFIFVPTLPGEPFRSKLASSTKEFLIQTPNKGEIHGLLLTVPQPKGFIFYLHGNTGSIKRWQFMAEELSLFGFDVFVMDYRGYGKSKGKRSEAVLHRDAEYCFDLLSKGYSRKIIYGRSLGSGFATRLAARRSANLLVLETPFFNLIDVATHYVPFLPVRYLLRYTLRSDIHIHHVQCPIHIFHGTKDTVVPYKSALKLYRKVEQRKDVWMTTVPGGKHSDLNRFPLFHERLREFLMKVDEV